MRQKVCLNEISLFALDNTQHGALIVCMSLLYLASLNLD